MDWQRYDKKLYARQFFQHFFNRQPSEMMFSQVSWRFLASLGMTNFLLNIVVPSQQEFPRFARNDKFFLKTLGRGMIVLSD